MPLNKKEKQWLLERRILRFTDQKEVQIYPMGAERFLANALTTPSSGHYPLQPEIQNKNVLVIPGFATSSFLFAEAGAHSVLAMDKDPLTIAWLKAFKLFYHYRQSSALPSVAELLQALTAWYPPKLSMPQNALNHFLWLFQPNALRRHYLHYLLDLIQDALRKNEFAFELERAIDFEVGTVENLNSNHFFDVAYVPYLLGVKNGIETEQDIEAFIHKLLPLSKKLLITPSQNNRDFYIWGQRYLILKNHQNLHDLALLKPYLLTEDKQWFRKQGLLILGLRD